MDRVLYRLANLSQADVTPVVPLASLPKNVTSGVSSLQDNGNSPDIHSNNHAEDMASSALKAAQLLQATDIGYLSLRDKEKFDVAHPPPVPGTLAAAVLAGSSHAFNYEPIGRRRLVNGGQTVKTGSSSHAVRTGGSSQAASVSPPTVVTKPTHQELPRVPVAPPAALKSNHNVGPPSVSTTQVKRKRTVKLQPEKQLNDKQIPIPEEKKKATSEHIVRETCEVLDALFERLEVGDDPSTSGAELLTVQELKQLYDQLLKLRLVLANLPLAYLTKLLMLLDRHVQHGRDVEISDADSMDSVKYQNIMVALEAAQVALTVMNAPDMPKQVYNEEAIESLVELTKFQTVHNIFPHFDASYRQLRGEVQEEQEDYEDGFAEGGGKRRKSKSLSGSGRGRKSMGPKTNRLVTNVCNKLVTSFGALGELLVNTRLQDTVVLQLNRVMLATFGVENIQVLQQKALNIECIIFEHYPQHRSTVMDEVITLFWKTPASKRNLRAFHFKEDDKQIQMITALILQLVQSCVSLPSLSATLPEVAADATDQDQKSGIESSKGYEGAKGAATYFWKQVLGRWSAGKQEGTDTKGLVENLVQDLLKSLNAPEFPAANLLLQVLCFYLFATAGRESKDVSVRCMAIDLLGGVAAHLKEDALKARNDSLWILSELKGRSHDSETGTVASGGQGGGGRKGAHDKCTVCSKERLNRIMLTCDGCHRKFHTDCIDLSEHEILGRKWLCHSCACRKQLVALRTEAAASRVSAASEGPRVQYDSCSVSGRGPAAVTAAPEGGGDDGLAVVQQLLLNYLQWAGTTDLLATYARRFYLCQWYRDENQVEGSLEFYRQRWRHSAPDHDSASLSSLRSRNFIIRISRALGQQHPLARGFDRILEWILASLQEAAPTPRAKALKAVGTIVEVDPTILTDERVQKAVEGRFLDSAISVREAAIDLVGKHIVNRPDFALQYYQRIAERMMDTGLSVRKRVIKTIRDVCIKNPGFARTTDACIRIIERISDDEASIQELVTKTFQELWFDELRGGSGHQSPLDVNSVPPEIADRTQQIVNVLRGLPNNSSLVAIVRRSLLGEGTNGVTPKAGPASFAAHAGVRRRCQQMCNCLLESILKAEETTAQEADAQALPFVLALHAFCTVDPTLCAPPSDPSRFAVTLQPYLKTQVATKDSSMLLQKIVFIIDGVLPLLRRPSQVFVDELERDLRVLITRDPRLAVVNACIKCLCSLRKVASSGLKAFDTTAKIFFDILKQHRCKPLEEKDRGNVMRSLFGLGLLCRFGTDGIIALETPIGLTMEVVAEIYRDYLRQSDFVLKMHTLQASGFLYIAKPGLMMGREEKRLLQASLSKGADWRLKLQTLKNFGLYLSDVEEKMAESLAGKDAAAVAEEHRTGAVPVAAGAGDQNNICGGIIQSHWDAIKDCMLDFNAEVRQQAAKVAEIVLRQGLVHPMSSVPHLIALGVDSQEKNSFLADKLINQLYVKYPSFVEGEVGKGLQLAFSFQQSGAAVSVLTPARPPPLLSSVEAAAGSSAGISRLYKLVRGTRTCRNKFLSSILRKFEVGTSANTAYDIPFLEYCANLLARLPFGVPDEPLYLVFHINRIIQIRAGPLLASIKDRMTGKTPLAAAVEMTVRAMRAEKDEDWVDAYDLEGTGRDSTPQIRNRTGTDTADVDLASINPESIEQMKMDCNAAMGMSLLLLLKQYLKVVYNLSDQRCQQYTPTEQIKPGDILQRRDSEDFETTLLPLNPPDNIRQMLKQYQVFKKLAKGEPADAAFVPTATPARRGRASMPKTPTATVEPEPDAAAPASAGPPSAEHRRTGGETVEDGEGGGHEDMDHARGMGSAQVQKKRRTSTSSIGGAAGRGRGRPPSSSKKKQRVSM